jgi:phage shock protein PspC (stress-responsive transcriptional regulator)
MSKMLQKLSSRKLWAAIAGIVTGLAVVFGLDQSIVTTVSGAVVSVASVVAYIVTEGKIDAAAVKTAVEDVQQAVTAVTTEDDKSE